MNQNQPLSISVDENTTKNLAETLARANRQAKLLNVAAQVSRTISSILDLDELLARTVDIICEEYEFYYAGIFLIETLDDGKDWAIFKAGRGEAGRIMRQKKHKLEVGGQSMVGACTHLNQARIASDVGQETQWFNNPLLPDTRSEMALPLAIASNVIGALTVQSNEPDAFSSDDISALQTLADQLTIAIDNARLHYQNTQLFKHAARRATFLQAGALVSRNISAILDLDELLISTVDLICDVYGFYYAGIFLVEEKADADGKTWAILRAGRGDAGRQMTENNHKMEVGGQSMVGQAIHLNHARIALDVDEEKAWYPNPLLPRTRSEMALPLTSKGRCIGGLTIQSDEEAAFSEEDISSLQIMADQLAVAIDNARLLHDLEQANQELVRTKTFETIATATGETIHWVGNKAAPIPGCVRRTREDLSRFIYIASELLKNQSEATQNNTLTQLIIQSSQILQHQHPQLVADVERLKRKPFKKLQRMLDIESVLEDLDIIAESAETILQIKEDLLGPARRQRLEEADIVDVVRKSLKGFSLPPDMLSVNVDSDLPTVKIDQTQMSRVIINLIKNALEAMDNQPYPYLFIALHRDDDDDNFVTIIIADNGSGIPEDELTKIWLTFHTSKADKGGTGLGLPACLQSMERMGGKISVTSKIGVGSTFTLSVPVYYPEEQNNQQIWEFVEGENE